MAPSKTSPAEPSLEVWRGSVSPWLCDEMGHMNMRYYLAIAEEGLVSLAAGLGMPRAFTPAAASTLLVREHHLRFLREAHSGDKLHVEAGLLGLEEDEGRVLQVVRHSDGSPSATATTRVAHATPTGRAFAWPRRTQEAAVGLACALPDYAAARSIPELSPEAGIDLARADDAGWICTGRGAVRQAECDVFGAMAAHALLGRVADGNGVLLKPVYRAVADHYPGNRVGGAALEYRIGMFGRPRTGDRLVLRACISRMDARVAYLRCRILDPETGEAVAAAEGAVASFDLDARRILPIPDAVRETFAPSA